MTPLHIVAVDPGDVHHGIAVFREDRNTEYGWTCILATELRGSDIWPFLEQNLGEYRPEAIIVERFTLYPHISAALTGKEMLTSETIGALSQMCRDRGIPMVKQPAAWQQPTLGVLRSKKILSTAKRDRSGSHALSAELHGWAYLMRSGVTTEATDLIHLEDSE